MAVSQAVFLSVTRLPAASDIPLLTARLMADFSLPENAAYLRALAPADNRHAHIAAARLGALSLLPPLLRRMGYDPAALALCRDAHGRPYLVAADGTRPADFNLSHSDAHMVCACVPAPHRVGVDVEEPILPSRAEALIRRFCTAGERALLAGDASLADGVSRPDFTCLWTVREAIAKHDGRGMPLGWDASAPPAGVRLLSGILPDTGAHLTLCVSGALASPLSYASDSLMPHPAFDFITPSDKAPADLG